MREITDINYFTTKELLAELRKRGALARIWEEGYGAGRDDEADGRELTDSIPNPYWDEP